MAVPLTTLIDRAKRRYGLATGMESAVLSQTGFLERINELMDEAGAVVGGWRETQTLNLSGTSADHTLSSRTVSVIENTVRIDRDGDGVFEVTPELADEQDLRRFFGPLENTTASVPGYYFVRRAFGADAMLLLTLYPASDTARTNGLKVITQVRPAPFVNLSDSFYGQQGEEQLLLPGVCLALAEVEMSRGRKDAPVAYWADQWEQALVKWQDVVEDMTRGDTRRIHRVDGPDYY